MSRVVALLRPDEEKLRIVKMADLVAFTNEHVQRRQLDPLCRLTVIVAVVSVIG